MSRRGAGAVVFACTLVLAGAPQAVHAGAITPLVPGVGDPDLVLRVADWQRREPHTIEDVLHWVAGLAIARNGGEGSLSMVSLLGSTSGRIQFSLDGVELAPAELHLPLLAALPVGVLDRIEIHRRTEPARIALWTREPTAGAVVAGIDLGRGDADSRTRRLQLVTPPRVVTVAVGYDETLHGAENFSDRPDTPESAARGMLDARTRYVRVDLRRAGQVVRLSHVNDNANAHGTLFSDTDVWRLDGARTDLRWDRKLGRDGRLTLDVGHQSWDQNRTIGSVQGPLREGRTYAALDLGREGTWSGWLRARTADINADGRATGDTDVQLRYAAHQAEVEVAREGPIDLRMHAGWIDDERSAADFTAGASAATDAAGFRLGAEAGRGVTIAGYGTPTDELRRRGEWLSAFAERKWTGFELRADVFGKFLQDRHRTLAAYFPGSGGGPERMAGVVAEGRWSYQGARWRGGLLMGAAYTPVAEGDRAGIASGQARLRSDWGGTWVGGDLTIDAFTDWWLDGEREWGTSQRMAKAARGDIGVDVGFLERLHFLGNIYNLTDTTTDSYPGVRLPRRSYSIAVRVRLVD